MKTIIALIAVVYSANSFSCSMGSSLGVSMMRYEGVTNKLYETERFSNYNIKSITNGDTGYKALLTDGQKCMSIVLAPYNTPDCQASANILNETNVPLAECM